MAKAENRNEFDPQATDPPLLERCSEVKCYSTSRFRYHDLRVFFRRHKHADQLPQHPAPLPLLVFIHGLGGSAAQFAPLLTSLTPIASCLAIDLPGCGRSGFTVRDWEAYSTDALAELLQVVIQDYRQKSEGQGVVLIAHSMGCSLAALVINPRTSTRTEFGEHVVGLVAICPSAEPPCEKQVSLYRRFFWIPEPVFNLWRLWDRRGGTESTSVRRFVGANADYESKRLQNLFNSQSKTPVWRRMAYGALPVYENGIPAGGMPGRETWAALNMPVFLVGGEGDDVTPAKNVETIAAYLRGGDEAGFDTEVDTTTEGIIDSAAPVDTSAAIERQHGGVDADQSNDDPSTPAELPPPPLPLPLPEQPARPRKVVRKKILALPATHALLYTPRTSRILAGLICTFLENHVTNRLSLSWQLQYLARDGKWDVKNLEKWQKVAPVSEPMAGMFRAMKTLRGVDEGHCPEEFARQWGQVIKDIIDISHDNPVYDPQELRQRDIRYHKFATVSKVPPTDAEVTGFIALVDEIRETQQTRAREEGWGPDYVVGVHCHYGFNRTGYFIVCYLVERCGYSVGDAIDLFARCRPKGIKHEHFKNQLHLRYSSFEHEDVHDYTTKRSMGG
ncbi:hypothetical protein P8C59_000643 [Phyllachora maydis]|uniref:Tyrosine specific protein phosphatases domain-containing protein n=1 Tax=Phyllachora maydis TaxID=1825666 RepID=A0AAD9HWJ5_9PEZI|nr:hypothetical protein P8C59_000643 [Phyllachora maydis]